MSDKVEAVWSPDESDYRRQHNNYVRNLIASYVSKMADLSEALSGAFDRSNYLVYGLTGRALIENVATLRYYVLYKYRPLLEKPFLTPDEKRSLIRIDDQHLRGSRFDWEAFLSGRYTELKDDTIAQLKADKKGTKRAAELTLNGQVNVLTCVQKWATESPEVMIAYALFCDLVHPNVGSSFMVASLSKDGMHFSPSKGEKVGKLIFEQTFPLLVSITHKPFGEYLSFLIATMWSDDEITPSGRA